MGEQALSESLGLPQFTIGEALDLFPDPTPSVTPPLAPGPVGPGPASGGFVLYPSRPNLNSVDRVYAK